MDLEQMEISLKCSETVRNNASYLPQTGKKFIELKDQLKTLEESNLEMFCECLVEEKQRLLLKSIENKESFVCGNDGDENDFFIPPLEEGSSEETAGAQCSMSKVCGQKGHQIAKKYRFTQNLKRENNTPEVSRMKRKRVSFKPTPPGQTKLTSYLNVEEKMQNLDG